MSMEYEHEYGVWNMEYEYEYDYDYDYDYGRATRSEFQAARSSGGAFQTVAWTSQVYYHELMHILPVRIVMTICRSLHGRATGPTF